MEGSMRVLEEVRQAVNQLARDRRARLAAKKVCINGASHGPRTHGCRCAWCDAVHRHGVAKVLEDPAAPARPPKYRVPTIAARDVSDVV